MFLLDQLDAENLKGYEILRLEKHHQCPPTLLCQSVPRDNALKISLSDHTGVCIQSLQEIWKIQKSLDKIEITYITSLLIIFGCIYFLQSPLCIYFMLICKRASSCTYYPRRTSFSTQQELVNVSPGHLLDRPCQLQRCCIFQHRNAATNSCCRAFRIFSHICCSKQYRHKHPCSYISCTQS